MGMDVSVVAGWLNVAAWAIVAAVVVWFIVMISKLPREEQTELVKKCLLSWVVQAEANLGSGTGRVKLSEVYGQFVTAFPTLSSFIPFETFSDWVDEALDTMRNMLAQNKDLRDVIGIEEGDLV